MRHRRVLVIVLVAGLAACSGTRPAPGSTDSSVLTSVSPETTTSTVAAPSSTEPPTKSTVVTSTTTVAEVQTRDFIVLLEPFASAGWEEALFVEYGPDDSMLGNGDLINEPWGPDLPVALDGQGRWWILDNYKDRIARYGSDGAFLDAIGLEAGGPLHGLQILDGDIAIASSTGSQVAVVVDSDVSYFELDRLLTLVNTDGHVAYGRETLGSRLYAVTIQDGRPIADLVTHLRTPAGSAYRITFSRNNPEVMTVSIPDAQPPNVVNLEMTAPDGGRVVAIAQVVGDDEGSLHILLAGISEAHDDIGIGKYTKLDASGAVVRSTPIPDPFGGRNPGTPNILGLDPVSGSPFIGVIDDNGVRVWMLEP